MFVKDDWSGVLVLKESIKHFESLQKRYTTQHNGKQCEYVKTALTAMRKQIPAKVVNRNGDYGECYICRHSFCGQLEYCPKCGQVLDWSED